MHVLKAHKDSGNQIISSKETENLCESNSDTSSVIGDTSSVESSKKVNCWCFECDRTFKTVAGLNMHRRAEHVDSILTNKSPQVSTSTTSEDRVSQSPVPAPIVTENVFKAPLPASTAEDTRTLRRPGGISTKFYRQSELEVCLFSVPDVNPAAASDCKVRSLFCKYCHRGPYKHMKSLNKHETNYHKKDVDSVRSIRSSANSSLNSSICDSDAESTCSVGNRKKRKNISSRELRSGNLAVLVMLYNITVSNVTVAVAKAAS